MEIFTYVVLPAGLAGLGALVDNALKGEPVLPCFARGLVSGWVVGVVAYLVFVFFNIHVG